MIEAEVAKQEEDGEKVVVAAEEEEVEDYEQKCVKNTI